ncbi:MAG TPA: rhomboid family intramembrane serine protease [Paludibacter sp.]
MLENSDNSTYKRQFVNAAFIPFIISILMILSFVLEKGMDWDFHTAGVYPRRIECIWGVFTLVFVHADWSHLINNVISFIILCSFLYYFYRELASRILIISYVFSGLILWGIGRESWHIGASGLIYALAFFLFFSGIIRKHVPLIAISLIVALIYGSMIWHIFPWEVHDAISWEGHLAGGIIGFILSIFYRNKGPKKPVKIWDDEDNFIEYISDEDETQNEDNKIG